MPRVVTVKLQVHLMTERPLIRFKDEQFIVWDQDGDIWAAHFDIHQGEDGLFIHADPATAGTDVPIIFPTLWARAPLARTIQAQFDLGYGEEKEIGSE